MASIVPNTPNTVRLVIAKLRNKSVGHYFVQKTLIEELFSMPRDSIFCVQCFPSSGLYDVTFWKQEDLKTCLAWKNEKPRDKNMEGITLLSSETNLRLPVIVHV